ncbi:hypothetical protein A2962_05590 [Candidatus Woesebacteria bacterium RIFCSPLOWO2_01_FULL_39_61]|uniref:Nudix hydrolase domain-containing protein n=2 Tax=Microgenomates group TaxID=1794810 RepID=A0A0H4T8Y5_9BACT|nr:hypothetical protein [uncultured Microgenomates bacterium Rifle_16ft_4_minimus_37836]OGM28060.1 MAG: hypothetical protein A2692_05330 [Candidatus Woesebacteria bacterium RIFCSPHIGHO2_01_FULL_39_95]OGM34048.1 MAG: hypothetical protein A3D01_03900 [Candidatus Woesebacteria bacterium RIFCSPHIGHO2_02_FULL_39_13]OGM38306.1 MAG: hypothetical protein A3E13_06010 [Candidatus Woesebacteria bacterium RIFCSPHIGHO2_12_FULL_40_20]OGM67769.1 MAG: hypothetical protein A2962_05590 [Candidatus Woesebacteria 
MSIVILSGACIVHKNKALLLQQPSSSRHPNLWGPPGGHREGKESLVEVAIREIKEETNLDVDIEGLVEAGIKTHPDGRISIVTLYFAHPLNLKEFKVDPSEVSDYKWVTLEEIERDLFPLRDSLLKPLLIKALTQKPSPIDAFKIY